MLEKLLQKIVITLNLKVLNWVILLIYKIILTVPCEKSKRVSYASSIMKSIAVNPAWSKFPVKIICCIAFGLVFIVY